MKLDTPLPSTFHDGALCLLDAFALKEQMTPQRVVRGSSGFETRLSPMKVKALRLRLDGALHGFVEAKGTVTYLPGGSHTVPNLDEPPPRMVAVQMIDHLATGSDPPARVLSPPATFEAIKPPRMVAIRRVTTMRELTLLLIDERNNNTIAVIGTKLHWNLEGLDVRFETMNGLELR